MNVLKHDIDISTAKPPAAQIPTHTPSNETQKTYSDAMAYLVFKWQLFAQMIYSGMEIKFTDSPHVPIAATDSHTIFINAQGFIDAGITDVLEIVFVLGHEVGHRIFNDLVMAMVWRALGYVPCPSGNLPYIPELMNWAEDYRINGMLVHTKLGRMPKVGLYDPKISAAGMESAIEIYEKLYKDAEREGRIIFGPSIFPGVKPGKGQPGGFDKHLDPSEQQIAKDKGKREQEIVSACQLAERTNPGSIPGSIQRLLDAIVDPKVPWQQHLKASMTRKAGLPKLDWRFHDRRLVGRDPSQYFAKRGHLGAGPIVMGGDNSGSMGKTQINTIAGEMSGIVADLNPALLTIYWCDSAITRTDELDEPTDLVPLFKDWKEKGVGGGGGTNFCPVFDAIEASGVKPDMLVYFTDGDGTFPSREPDYPVIWGDISGRPSKYPWGEVIHVEVK